MNTLAWTVLAGGLSLGVIIGMVITDHFNWSYLQIKAERENRTPMCIKGKFYYVIPETEFVHEWVPRELLRKP